MNTRNLTQYHDELLAINDTHSAQDMVVYLYDKYQLICTDKTIYNYFKRIGVKKIKIKRGRVPIHRPFIRQNINIGWW